MRDIKRKCLYTLEVEVVSGSADVASIKPMSETRLWNMRLSHVSERGLVKLSKQNHQFGDNVEILELCKPCDLVNPVG